ncbi:MAG TPA: hypothetical protein V6D48_25400 [Oculatellaceae cyanobacterium]
MQRTLNEVACHLDKGDRSKGAIAFLGIEGKMRSQGRCGLYGKSSKVNNYVYRCC